MTQPVFGESARVYRKVPQLERMCEQVAPEDIWPQPDLTYRDRILVTCSILAAGGKLDELKVWMRRGVENGISLDDLRGLIVLVAFYAGWPAGLCAAKAALELFEAEVKLLSARERALRGPRRLRLLACRPKRMRRRLVAFFWELGIVALTAAAGL